ncbi:hypothetical protein HJC23_006807 [Cyclotella cryptica]|uniref:dolichyl-phosphate beta-D-mannosyltransferase n=1 Tax=Cyclotella cryptica TaxID=29204 RepID=A0ABD3PFW5_9STRA
MAPAGCFTVILRTEMIAKACECAMTGMIVGRDGWKINGQHNDGNDYHIHHLLSSRLSRRHCIFLRFVVIILLHRPIPNLSDFQQQQQQQQQHALFSDSSHLQRKGKSPLITQFLHDTFTSANLKYEIVVVDDSSPDNTLEVAQRLQTLFGEDHIRIVSRPGKLGLGSAYSAGLKASSGERIILMDADLSHHPKFIPKMISVMDGEGVEIVSGTRYRRGGGVAGWDTFRKLTSCGANFLATFCCRRVGRRTLLGRFDCMNGLLLS